MKGNFVFKQLAFKHTFLLTWLPFSPGPRQTLPRIMAWRRRIRLSLRSPMPNGPRMSGNLARVAAHARNVGKIQLRLFRHQRTQIRNRVLAATSTSASWPEVPAIRSWPEFASFTNVSFDARSIFVLL